MSAEPWTHNREAKMGRLRIWLDDDTKKALDWLRDTMRVGPTRIVGVALTLLWAVMAEKKSGRRIISVDQDGNNPKDIM
jgi:hypothetical protein